MNETQMPIQFPGTIHICMDEYDAEEILCRVYCPGSREPLLFRELGKMLIDVDRVLDEMHFPEASTNSRSFGHPVKLPSGAKERMIMQNRANTQQKGGKGTFVVQIQYRQHSTWQGKVLWAEKNETMQFRSALELLKMIDNALDESAEESQAIANEKQ